MAGVLCVSAQVGESRSTVTLNVQVDGFKNAAGAAGIALWDAARGFPEEIEHAVATTYATIQDGVAMARFDQLEPGTYAITVYHDRTTIAASTKTGWVFRERTGECRTTSGLGCGRRGSTRRYWP